MRNNDWARTISYGLTTPSIIASWVNLPLLILDSGAPKRPERTFGEWGGRRKEGRHASLSRAEAGIEALRIDSFSYAFSLILKLLKFYFIFAYDPDRFRHTPTVRARGLL